MDIFNGRPIPSHCRRVMELLHLQSVSSEKSLCDVKFICNRGKDEVYAHSMVLEKGTEGDSQSGVAQIIRSGTECNRSVHRLITTT